MTVRLEVPFAAVPEWLLDAEVSDRAVRLYGILARYAGENGSAHPSRRTLARRIRCSVDSVDRAMRELEAVGAVVIERRRTDAGDQDVNRYVVMSTAPAHERPGGRTDAATSGRTGAATGGRTGAARSRASLNESQLNERTTDEAAPAQAIEPKTPRPADPVWDALVACFGPAPIEASFRGAWNRAAKEIRGQLGASGLVVDQAPRTVGEEVALRFAAYRATMPDVACTPTALAKHWGRLTAPAARPVSKFEAARAERRLRDGARTGGGDRGNGARSVGLEDAAGNVRPLDVGDGGARRR